MIAGSGNNFRLLDNNSLRRICPIPEKPYGIYLISSDYLVGFRKINHFLLGWDD